jgi:hypothetical protein
LNKAKRKENAKWVVVQEGANGKQKGKIPRKRPSKKGVEGGNRIMKKKEGQTEKGKREMAWSSGP